LIYELCGAQKEIEIQSTKQINGGLERSKTFYDNENLEFYSRQAVYWFANLF